MRHNHTGEVLPQLMQRACAWIGRPPGILDLFCGDGRLMAHHLVPYAGSYIGLDADKAKLQQHQLPFRESTLIHADAVEWIAHIHHGQVAADLLVIDNPLFIFGPSGQYTEHFNVLDHAWKVLADRSCIILDVVPRPYNASNEQNREWLARRRQYYGVDNAADIADDVLLDFYFKKLEAMGYRVCFSDNVCREYEDGLDYFHFFYFELLKNADR